MQSGKESHCCLIRTHWPLAQRNWLGRQMAARGSRAFRGDMGRDAARCATWRAKSQCSPPQRPSKKVRFQMQSRPTGPFLGWGQGAVTANLVSTLPTMSPGSKACVMLG